MNRTLLVILAFSTPLAGCIDPETEPTVDVVATFYPIAFVAERLAADDVRVATFVPPGADPRTYEPSPRDYVRVSNAKLVLYNGEGLEPWIDQLRRAAPRAEFVAVTRNITFLEDEGFPEDASNGEKTGAAHGAVKYDPHVWLDPIRMKSIVDETETALASLGVHEQVLARRADALLLGLDSLHVRYDEGLAKCETRHMFVTRPAFGYLVVRYNLYQHGFSNMHPAAEATPRRMVAEADLARALGADVIFEDPRADPALANAFAKAIGGRVLHLDPLEGLSNEARREGANYFSIMDANLAQLRVGLGCA